MAAVISPLLQFLGGPIVGLIEKFIPDPQAQAQAKLALLGLQQNELFKQIDSLTQIAQAQSDVNKVEAASPNLFIAGGRPFIIWICGIAFGMNYVVGPIATWGAALAGHPDIKFPQLDLAVMMPVLLGLLGLGGMRTVEKLNNAAGNH